MKQVKWILLLLSAKVMSKVNSSKMLKATKVEAEKIYAFNVEGGGYVIASGDSRTLPVLGYSDSGSIDWTNMPENMRAWLKGYDEAIATLGNSTDFADGNLLTAECEQPFSTRLARTAVEPLITTQWNQLAPYWNKIPLYDGADPDWQGKNCLTGCPATVMAQIMKYYEWPKTETRAIPAYDQETYDDGISKTWHIDELPPVTFDWANMIDQYTIQDDETGEEKAVGTEAQQDAVATLMRYCSQAFEMELTPVTSGAGASAIPRAYYYMGYAPSVQLVNRAFFCIDEWEELIYGELSAKRPVQYNGFSSDDGHSFICDGYDGNGMFHINWGWSGSYDGYYSLSVLNPYYDSSLGRAKRMGFSRNQGAVIGIQPPSEGTTLPPLGRVMIYNISLNSDSIVEYNFRYAGGFPYPNITQDYALGTIEADGKLKPRFIGDPNDSIVYHDNRMTVVIDTAAIQSGESLQLYPMMKFRHHPESDWQLFDSQAYFVHVGRTADGDYYSGYVNMAAKQRNMKVIDAKVNPSTSAPFETIELTLTIHNEDKTDYVGNLKVTPDYYGDINPDDISTSKVKVWGNSVTAGAYIRAGQDAEVKFYIKSQMNGVVRLGVETGDNDPLNNYIIVIEAPVAITSISADDSNTSDAPYYDLQGRRLTTRPVHPGVYLYKGRKVVIR